VRDAESTNNASPYEVLNIFGQNGRKWFDLDPFGKVVDSHQEELSLPFSWCEGTDDVHRSDGERPWGDEIVQLFWPSMMEGVELLAFGTFFHVLSTAPLDGRPVVACPQDFGSSSPLSGFRKLLRGSRSGSTRLAC